MTALGVDVVHWDSTRAGELARLWNRGAPNEPLSVDELAGVCFDDGGAVLATPNGSAAIACVVRPGDHGAVGHVRLVVVDPDVRRQGIGGGLLAAAERWLFDHGATRVCLGGEAPVYLWPGVDANDVATSCLAEAAGYVPTASAINMAIAASFRSDAPTGVVVRRLVADSDVAAVRTLVAEHWPQWLVEFDLGVDTAGVHGAFDTGGRGQAVGFCAHSVLRTGWLGPMGVDPKRQAGGVGAALVSAVCTDAMVAGLDHVEVSWVGPIRFYAKLGGRVSRSFRRWEKPLTDQRA